MVIDMQEIKKVLCFGELLMRMSPSPGDSWISGSAMKVYIGGAELNVAQALAKWGIPVSYCTVMPSNALTESIAGHLSKKGIDTAPIKYQGERLGLYYMAQGADLKNAGVLYDRAYSSFALLNTGAIDWDSIFEGVDWFHFSAIIPAISQELVHVCEEALEAAAERGIIISLDLNYRAKLWKYGKAPHEVMPGLAKYCDVIMGNIWADELMLGVPLSSGLQDASREQYLRQSLLSSQAIQEAFPKCSVVAHTFRFTGQHDSEINYYGTLYQDGELYHSAIHHSDKIVDKAGTGDCFMAGLIYSFANKLPGQEAIDLAAAAAFSKFFIVGDATDISIQELKKIYRK
jgi:2-dehydro-3-deoxygluconokinase